MKVRLKQRTSGNEGAFSLVEIVVAAGLIGIMFVALLSGLTSSVSNIQFGREQMRATQIMVEKLDTLRLYNWDNLNSSYISTSFTNAFHPGIVDKRGQPIGKVFYGNVEISDPPITEPYANGLKQVSVSLKWESGGRTVTRRMSTLVAEYGLQNYIR